MLPRRRIVRADLRADAIFQRRDDLAARRVVLRVRAEHQQDVEPEPHRVSFDLDVPFLKDVEQPDLNLAGEIRQLVDGEDPAVRARQQPVVHRQLVRQLEPGPGGLDRVEVADHVGDRHVGRREFFNVARFARKPRHRQRVAFRGNARTARRAERRQRIVVNLAAGHDRNGSSSSSVRAAQNAAFRLPAQPEQDEVVARQDGVDDLRDDRFVVPDDAGKIGCPLRRRTIRFSRISSLTDRRATRPAETEARNAPSVEGSSEVIKHLTTEIGEPVNRDLTNSPIH